MQQLTEISVMMYSEIVRVEKKQILNWMKNISDAVASLTQIWTTKFKEQFCAIDITYNTKKEKLRK